MKTAQHELVYSDSALCAFLTAIVRAFERFHGNQHYLGRTAMQKLSYFAQVLGAPIPCSFEIYTYGPYSEKVTFAIDSLIADDVLEDKSANTNYSNYRLGGNGNQILSKYHPAIDPYADTIEQVVKVLGKLEPGQFELLATLHFIGRRLKEIKRREPSKKEVIDDFCAVKKNKFDKAEIETVYSALKSANLMKLDMSIASSALVNKLWELLQHPARWRSLLRRLRRAAHLSALLKNGSRAHRAALQSAVHHSRRIRLALPRRARWHSARASLSPHARNAWQRARHARYDFS